MLKAIESQLQAFFHTNALLSSPSIIYALNSAVVLALSISRF